VTAQVFGAVGAPQRVPGLSLDAVQRESVAIARVARHIAADDHKEEAFTAGLLHDLGLLVLALLLPQRLQQVVAASRAAGVPLHVKEQEMLGVSHAKVGGYLLGLWGIPLPIVEAVVHHHAPSAATTSGVVDALAAVHIAGALVRDAVDGRRDATLDEAYVAAVGVADEITRFRAVAEREVRALAAD
jgi:HD-like signal output (HDOD) protein